MKNTRFATAQETVNTEILKSVDAEEVNSLVSSPRTTLASGNRSVVYQQKVNSGKGGLPLQCRENKLSRGHLHSRIFAAIPGGTKNWTNH